MKRSRVVQLPLWDIHEKPPVSFSNLSKIRVMKNSGVRKLHCFCGAELRSSILPHLKKMHPETWEDWRSGFVKLHNLGWSSRKIMKGFSVNGKLLFSWTVIERELRRMEELGIADLKISRKKKLTEWEPQGFKIERTTVWDFQRRGDWAVHRGDYRGNWPPQLARNLILRYSKPNELLLDVFAGGGTTLIEAWLLGRKSIGIDLSPLAIKTISARLQELEEYSNKSPKARKLNPDSRPIIINNDSLKFAAIMESQNIQRGSIALIAAHPPYFDSIEYTSHVEGDLSRSNSIDEFVLSIRKLGESAMPWLRPGGIFAVLIGDVRKKKKLIPLGFLLQEQLTQVGYELREVIIKTQNRDKSTGFWFNRESLDFLIAHEYLLIFSRPAQNLIERANSK